MTIDVTNQEQLDQVMTEYGFVIGVPGEVYFMTMSKQETLYVEKVKYSLDAYLAKGKYFRPVPGVKYKQAYLLLDQVNQYIEWRKSKRKS
jgi:hypothetical protein